MRDVQSLSRGLGLPAETVLVVMNSGGMGYKRRTSVDAAAASESGVMGGAGTAAVAGVSAWSDFMSNYMPSALASRSRSE